MMESKPFQTNRSIDVDTSSVDTNLRSPEKFKFGCAQIALGFDDFDAFEVSTSSCVDFRLLLNMLELFLFLVILCNVLVIIVSCV